MTQVSKLISRTMYKGPIHVPHFAILLTFPSLTRQKTGWFSHPVFDVTHL